MVNKQELKSLMQASKEKRYEYFIKRIVDFEEVWSLYESGWAMTKDDHRQEMIPFWPAKEYAEYCANGV